MFEMLKINEQPGGLYATLLPPCDASILRTVLDPDAPYVWLIGLQSQAIREWMEKNMPPILNVPDLSQTVRITRLELDVNLSTSDFLRILPSFGGVELIQANRPLPSNFYLHGLKPESRGRVFCQVGVVLHFDLPGPYDSGALVTSPHKNVLERILAALPPHPWRQ